MKYCSEWVLGLKQRTRLWHEDKKQTLCSAHYSHHAWLTSSVTLRLQGDTQKWVWVKVKASYATAEYRQHHWCKSPVFMNYCDDDKHLCNTYALDNTHTHTHTHRRLTMISSWCTGIRKAWQEKRRRQYWKHNWFCTRETPETESNTAIWDTNTSDAQIHHRIQIQLHVWLE